MWKLVVATGIATALALVIVAGTQAASPPLRARLQPVGGSHVHGTVVWRGMSEQFPLRVRIRGAVPLSQVSLRVCGLTEDSVTGNRFDQCWATFTDPARHILSIQINRRGRAQVKVIPKLAVASVHLLKAERVELYDYPSGELIAIGQMHERGRAGAD
jgi:hypothetical protein